jgi:hypothetical protein
VFSKSKIIEVSSKKKINKEKERKKKKKKQKQKEKLNPLEIRFIGGGCRPCEGCQIHRRFGGGHRGSC